MQDARTPDKHDGPGKSAEMCRSRVLTSCATPPPRNACSANNGVPAAPLCGSAPRFSRLRIAGLVGGLALALSVAACGHPVSSDEPATAVRPNVSNVQHMEATAGPSRADQYRATAAAYEAERAAEGAADGAAETDDFGDIVTLLRMPAAHHILIPSIGVDAAVEDVGTELKDGELVWEVIEDIAGHHRASANPGEPGNIVVTGHVESRSSGNVFLNLPNIQVGDEVTMTSPAGEFVYVVTAVDIRHESEIGVLTHGYEEKLTLITCVPDGIYDHRVIVTAMPADLIAST